MNERFLATDLDGSLALARLRCIMARRPIQYPQSVGSIALDTLIREAGFSNSEVAKAVDVSDVSVYHWRIGAKVPGPVNRRELERWTKSVAPKRGLAVISPIDWETEIREAA